VHRRSQKRVWAPYAGVLLLVALLAASPALMPGAVPAPGAALADDGPNGPPQPRTPPVPTPDAPTVTASLPATRTGSPTRPPPTPAPERTRTPTPAVTVAPTPTSRAPVAATSAALSIVAISPAPAALRMLAPVCSGGGDAISWSWVPAPDAAGYLLQVSTTAGQLDDGTLADADTFNGRLDATNTTFSTPAVPGQPYFAVVLPLSAAGLAETDRVSLPIESVCIDAGASSRPLPPTQAPAPPAAAVADAAAPAAPSDLVATPLDASEVRLDWTSNSEDEGGFAVDDGYSVVAQVPAGVTTITLVGLDPDGPYCAAVYAYNQAGASDLSNFVCFTTLSDTGDSSTAREPAAGFSG